MVSRGTNIAQVESILQLARLVGLIPHEIQTILDYSINQMTPHKKGGAFCLVPPLEHNSRKNARVEPLFCKNFALFGEGGCLEGGTGGLLLQVGDLHLNPFSPSQFQQELCAIPTV